MKKITDDLKRDFNCKLKYNTPYLIVIEGCDGSGKTTVAKNLTNILIDYDYDAISISNPGTSDVSKSIKQIIANNNNMSNLEYSLLFSAGILYNLRTIVKPALENNKVVIIDRFIRSTYIYQNFKSDLDLNDSLDFVCKDSLFRSLYLNMMCYIAAIPKYEFILQIDTDLAIKRINERDQSNINRSSKFESTDRDYIDKINNLYKTIKLPGYDFSLNINANVNLFSIINQIMDKLGKDD